MALGQSNNTSRKYYLTLSEGKVVHKDNGTTETYAYISGKLKKIYKLERTFNGEKVFYWYIDIQGENGDLYSLFFPYRSGIFKSIVLCLASDKLVSLRDVKIEPYLKDGYTKVVVSTGDKRLDWVTKELPEVTDVKVGDKLVKDDTKRMDFINSLVNEINSTI